MNIKSLEFKIPFLIVIFALVCVLLTSSLLQYIVIQNIEGNILDKNLIISRMISEQISIYLTNAQDTVVTAANFSSQSYGEHLQIQKEIFRIYDNFDYFDLIFYMDNDAKMVFSKPSNYHVSNRIYTDRNYYWETVKKGKVTISPLLISSVLNIPHFIISAPVLNKDNHIIGLIGAGIPLNNIKEIVYRTQKHFNGKIWITDANGNIAVNPQADNELELIKLQNHNVISRQRKIDIFSILENKTEDVASYIIDETQYYGAISFVPEVNWMVVVEQDKDAVFTEIIQLEKQIKKVIILVTIFALILGLIIARRITKPIEMLVKQVRRLSLGLKKPQPILIGVKTNDEIGELSKAFEDMSIKLTENINELEESFTRENELQRYLNNILLSVASGILVIDKKDKITMFNKEAENILETEANEYLNKSINEFCEKTATKLNNGMRLDYLLEKVMDENNIFTDIEGFMMSRRDREVPVSISASPVLNTKEEIIGTVLLFRDMTKFKAIEDELRREEHIRTLGELSASIIHDIGNPLAGIGNLIEILKDNSYDSNSRTEVLDVLEKEISDLNKLVIDFLEFSHIPKLEKEQTSIRELIENVIVLLKPEIINKNVNINIKTQNLNQFIKINIDRRKIKQVLMNILKNSIQAVDENGKINIEIVKDYRQVQIVIKDNGVGISNEKLDRIFNPFYTTKKDGIGLGLSIVYKLIKQHEGQISVKSTLGIGTEFIVTIPLD